MGIRNKTLHKKIKKFIVSSISMLDSFTSKGALPIKPEFFSDGEAQIDYYLFIFRHFKDLEKLPEFLDCAKYILTNPITLRATGWRAKEENNVKDLPLELSYFRILYYILGACVKLTNDFSFDKEVYEKVYKDFEKSVYSSFSVHSLTAPMEGIFGDVKKVNFGRRIKLRKILEKEKKSYIRQFTSPSSTSIPNINIHRIEFMLEGTHTQNKDKGFNTSTIVNEFKEIITLLRLFKAGRVGFSFIKTEAITWAPQFGVSHQWSYSRQGRIFPNSYELNKSEISKLLKLWRRYKKYRKTVGSSKNWRYFNLALKWFNMGVEENDYENKMIDFFIAFEALCLPEVNELSYRLSNRVAVLLDTNYNEPEKIRKFMVKAYTIRSNIVHGARVRPIFLDGEIIQLRDFILKVEQYLREVLKMFLMLSPKYGKQSDIIGLIDKSLHDVKTRRKIKKMVVY